MEEPPEYIKQTFSYEGHTISVLRRNLEGLGDDYVDPNFFDDDYTPAASTGFAKVWDGTWALLAMLRSSRVGAALRGRRVVELGSGTGFAGLCAAALGAHVLLTDVPSVTHGLIRRNVALNEGLDAAPREASGVGSDGVGHEDAGLGCRGGIAGAANCDSTCIRGEEERGLESARTEGGAAEGHADTCVEQLAGHRAGSSVPEGEPRASDALPWAGSVRVGAGSVATMPLDWTRPVAEQVPAAARSSGPAAAGQSTAEGAERAVPGGNDPRDADAIIACEVIWLKELIEPYVDTVCTLLRAGRARQCFMSYTNRGHAASTVFAHEGEVRGLFEARGCDVAELPEFQTATEDGEPVVAWCVMLARRAAVPQAQHEKVAY